MSANDCEACLARGKTWDGDDPMCAFRMGRGFRADNWNCATVGLIRDLVYEGGKSPPAVDYRYCEDSKYATIQVDDIEGVNAMALWVAWYKNRGKTGAMWLLDYDAPPRLPTEAECLLIVAALAETQRSDRSEPAK